MFATCRCTVCSLSTSDPAISRFERPAATRRSTSASRRLSGESPFDECAGVVVEEPGERALDLTLVVDVRQVRVTAQRDEARVRKKRRELAPSAIGTVRSPRRWSTSAGIVTLERNGRASPYSSRSRNAAAVSASAAVTLVPAERSDLVAARMRDDQAGEHLGRERPVDADEVDDRPPRRFGQIVSRYEAPEEHDLPDDAPARVPRGSPSRRPSTSTRTRSPAPPPHASITERSVRVSRSMDAGPGRTRSERPEPSRS